MLLTIRFEGMADASLQEKQEVVDSLKRLQAHLGNYQSATILSGTEDNVTSGLAKPIGTFGDILLGVLSAEVHSDTVAIKILRFLFSNILQKQSLTCEIELSNDGVKKTGRVIVPLRSLEEVQSVFNQLEAFVSGSN